MLKRLELGGFKSFADKTQFDFTDARLQSTAAIVKEYAKAVKKLIKRGTWNEMPPPEDQLPDECMPKEFFEYWASRQSTR